MGYGGGDISTTPYTFPVLKKSFALIYLVNKHFTEVDMRKRNRDIASASATSDSDSDYKPSCIKRYVNEDLLLKLAAHHCTYEEMASICGCSVDTLVRRYKKKIMNAQKEGKASLRRLQWRSAQEGSIPMQIWLGKQLLGQRDKFEDVDNASTIVVKGVRLGQDDADKRG